MEQAKMDELHTILEAELLQAYNERDIDAFMECWSDDCQYYSFPDQLLARGKAAKRRFASATSRGSRKEL